MFSLVFVVFWLEFRRFAIGPDIRETRGLEDPGYLCLLFDVGGGGSVHTYLMNFVTGRDVQEMSNVAAQI